MTPTLAARTERLRGMYAAFNRRDVDAATGHMTADVRWPRAFKGGFVQGPEAVGAYWREQWGEVSPTVEPVDFHADGAGADADTVLVTVRQVVRDLQGHLLDEARVGHRYTFDADRIRAMELAPLPG